jgi:hypothetical protein
VNQLTFALQEIETPERGRIKKKGLLWRLTSPEISFDVATRACLRLLVNEQNLLVSWFHVIEAC